MNSKFATTTAPAQVGGPGTQEAGLKSLVLGGEGMLQSRGHTSMLPGGIPPLRRDVYSIQGLECHPLGKGT